jgi:APA family basic amino acid/polyamine antiporter
VRVPGSAAALAIVIIWIFVAINVAGVGLAGRVQIVTTALQLMTLVVVAVGGVFFFRADALAMPSTDQTPAAAQILTVVTLTLWAFLGLECATIPAGSVRDPARTIPLATIVGTTFTALIYIVSTIGVMSLMTPEALATSTAPFADGARQLIGDAGGQFVALGAAISCAGALNGWVLIAGQLPMAAAADGLLPPVFGHLSRQGTPARGMIIAGVLASLLVAMNYSRGLVALFTFIILLSTLSTLVPYAFCSLAVWLMPGKPAPRGAAAVVSVMAFVYAMFAIYGAGAETVFYGFLLLLGGLPIYVWLRSVPRERG